MNNLQNLSAIGALEHLWLERRDCPSLVRKYMETIEPFQKLCYDIYSVVKPTLTISLNGKVEINYNFTEIQKEILQQLEELKLTVWKVLSLGENHGILR